MEDKIKKSLSDKGLSESSIKNYMRNLKILNDDKIFKNLTFLKDKENIVKIVEAKKPNTQRNYYISIASVLHSEEKPNKKLYDFYYDKMMQLNKTLKEEQNKNEKSESQKKNWVTEDEVNNKMNELKEKISKYKKNLSEKEYKNVLSYMIISLYALTQPRRNADYQFMNIVSKNVPDTISNFLVYDKKEFWFRKYKTAKSELKKSGEKELKVDIPDNLMNAINLYLKFHPLLAGKKVQKNTDVPFLVSYDGQPLKNVNSITYIINRIFGKNTGSSILRHAYLSEKHGKEMDAMIKDAKNMSHSLEMQKEYIKK